MFLNKHLICAMLNTDLSMAAMFISLRRKDCAFIPLLYPMTHINTASYFLAVIMDGFIMITTYGCLPFYLMDEKLQNGRMNGGHAREEFSKLNTVT